MKNVGEGDGGSESDDDVWAVEGSSFFGFGVGVEDGDVLLYFI